MKVINVQVRSNGFEVELFFKDGVWTDREGHSSYDNGYRLNTCKPVNIEQDIDAMQAIAKYEALYNCKLKVVRNLRKV